MLLQPELRPEEDAMNIAAAITFAGTFIATAGGTSGTVVGI